MLELQILGLQISPPAMRDHGLSFVAFLGLSSCLMCSFTESSRTLKILSSDSVLRD